MAAPEPAEGEWISARHKNVVVIGGGDTGTDCVGTSVRHGCAGIVQFEIMNRATDTRPADNPWPEWPRIFRTDYGQEEAIDTFGKDPRQYAITTKRFAGDAKGHVREVHTVRVDGSRATAGRASGRFRGPKSAGLRSWCCSPWASSGQRARWSSSLGSSRTAGRTCGPSTGSLRRTCPGVFAAGDMRRGQSLVVWAINEGRAVPRECDRFLMGSTQLA